MSVKHPPERAVEREARKRHAESVADRPDHSGSHEAPRAFRSAGNLMLIASITSLALMLVGLFTGIFALPTLIVAVQVRRGTRHKRAKAAAIGGVFASLFCANVIGIVLCVIAWMRLGQPEVLEWLERG